ncbi:hypothetical protein [Roseimicrobium sp. ORNL1]|uniref:hypothetical protein n=1 Tax=Roseimicrobium sp. ORNL1 TaxID=2711231 RepID=UPI0013E167E0|nr:hypothetical protein [Roseimicrobium sp. ORNL1]QIF05023.1 hypothetical protein G5S37_27090 [Roseimicrobium sp. ORNL1]
MEKIIEFVNKAIADASTENDGDRRKEAAAAIVAEVAAEMAAEAASAENATQE